MRRGLIVRGRRYYSPKLNEYVIAIKRNRHFATYRRTNGDIVRLAHKNVWYLSIDDFNMCAHIGTAAKMNWFDARFDKATCTEFIEPHGIEYGTSYRNAVRDLAEGTVDQSFEWVPNCDPKDYSRRFSAVLQGMGIVDSRKHPPLSCPQFPAKGFS